MTAKTHRAIGYLRVSKMGSRQVDDDSTQTLKVQRQRIEGLAQSRGWTIVGWYQDLDCSGGNTDRAQFQAAMAAIEAGDADVFACAFLDRFSRSVDDTIQQERRIREAGGSLVVSDVNVDTTTPMGRGMFAIMAVMNQIFLDQKTEQFNEHRSNAVSRGVAPARAPLGYRKIDAPGTDQHRRYEIVEEEAEIVRLAFQLRADGVSCPEVARELNGRGYRSRRGAQWTDRTIRNLLAVRTYTGDVTDGDHVYRDAHPAIVSRDVWRQVQFPTPTPRAQAAANPGLLTGVVRCASCSYAMVVQGVNGGGSDHVYYRCRGVHSGGRCAGPASIRLDALDAHVERDFLATADQHLTRLVGFDTDGNADVEQAIADAQLELEAFHDGASIAALGADRYNREAAKRQAVLDKAIEARTRSQRGALPHVGYRAVADVWQSLTVTEKREVLHATLDAVFVQPAPRSHSADPVGRTWIAPSGTVAVDLPRRGVGRPLTQFVFPSNGPVDNVGALAA
jgi:DNA invertase Pin-like site-specific DNA recombinase